MLPKQRNRNIYLCNWNIQEYTSFRYGWIQAFKWYHECPMLPRSLRNSLPVSGKMTVDILPL